MNNSVKLHTRLCDILGCQYPILLAGMGGLIRVTNPELVAAVSNAGGVGVLGAVSLQPEEIRSAIHKIRQMTDKPFGIDIAVPAVLAKSEVTWEETDKRIAKDYPKHVAFVQELIARFNLQPVERKPGVMFGSLGRQQVKVILEEHVPLLAAALGDPSWVVPLAHEAGTKVLGMAGSVENALRHKKSGVDIIVAQGTEAGGHTGRIASLPLTPAVVDAVSPTPVVSAGGIVDGRGLVAALALGAVGAWVGTAFLAAKESSLPPIHWDEIRSSSMEDFTISRVYTGKTSRGFKNAFKDAWEKSGLPALPMPLQSVLLKPLMDAAIAAGRIDLILNGAGQTAGTLREKRPAREILEGMVKQAADILRSLPRGD